MRIYRPIKSNKINQYFGEAKVCVDSNGKVYNKVPFTNTGTCPLGTEDLYSTLNLIGHNGIDFNLYRGEAVYHSGDWDGIVKTEIDSNGGIGITITSETAQLNGNRVRLRYWHLLKVAPDIYDGKKISVGTLIGYGDSTGLSSGDHLHFDLKEVSETGTTLNKANGYLGAIDPLPYLENKFIVDVFDELQAQILTLSQLVAKFIAQFKGHI